MGSPYPAGHDRFELGRSWKKTQTSVVDCFEPPQSHLSAGAWLWLPCISWIVEVGDGHWSKWSTRLTKVSVVAGMPTTEASLYVAAGHALSARPRQSCSVTAGKWLTTGRSIDYRLCSIKLDLRCGVTNTLSRQLVRYFPVSEHTTHCAASARLTQFFAATLKTSVR